MGAAIINGTWRIIAPDGREFAIREMTAGMRRVDGVLTSTAAKYKPGEDDIEFSGNAVATGRVVTIDAPIEREAMARLYGHTRMIRLED